METRFKTGDMVAVGNTVVIAQHRGSHLVLCSADTADVIGNIDISDLCSIYREWVWCVFVGSRTDHTCVLGSGMIEGRTNQITLSLWPG